MKISVVMTVLLNECELKESNGAANTTCEDLLEILGMVWLFFSLVQRG